MTCDGLRGRLHGVIAPAVTPFRADGTLDLDAVYENAAFLVAHGVTALAPCGTVGEFASLTLEERETVLEHTLRAAGGKALVIAHVSATDEASMLRLARHAADAGADAALVLPPYYFRLNDDELLAFFRWLDKTLPLPFLVYNNPATTGMSITDKHLETLIDMPRFAGVKEGHPDVLRFHRLVRRFGAEAPIIAANESQLAFFLLSGARSLMTSGVAYAPELFAALLDAASRRDVDETWRWFDHILALRQPMMPALQRGYPAYIPYTKLGVELRGLRAGAPRPPLRPVDPPGREAFEKAVREHVLPLATSRITNPGGCRS